MSRYIVKSYVSVQVKTGNILGCTTIEHSITLIETLEEEVHNICFSRELCQTYKRSI